MPIFYKPIWYCGHLSPAILQVIMTSAFNFEGKKNSISEGFSDVFESVTQDTIYLPGSSWEMPLPSCQRATFLGMLLLRFKYFQPLLLLRIMHLDIKRGWTSCTFCLFVIITWSGILYVSSIIQPWNFCEIIQTKCM